MRAVQLALIHFGSTLLKSKVLSRCDNSTVVLFQHGRGDEVLSTVMLVWEIFQWSISYNSCGIVSFNTDLSSLIKGIFNNKPCVRPLHPKRDLPLVLLALCKPPFEQLATCH